MTKKFSTVQKMRQLVCIRKYHFLSKEVCLIQFTYKNQKDVIKNKVSLFQKNFTSSVSLPKKISKTTATVSSQTLFSPVKKNSEKKIIPKSTKEVQKSFNSDTNPSPKTLARFNKNSSQKDLLQDHPTIAQYPPSSSATHPLISVAAHNNTIAFKQTEHAWCIAVAPVHLRGLDIIRKVFGKSRATVKSWRKEGAPIAYDGISYSTEYNTLFAWYLNHCASYSDNSGE